MGHKYLEGYKICYRHYVMVETVFEHLIYSKQNNITLCMGLLS